jgi:hypothetical protein
MVLRLDGDKIEGGALGLVFRFFLTSGFCGIFYELVWLGLAMAQSALASVRPSPIQKLSHHFSRDHASA